LLGHASIVLTADTYTSVLDEHARRVARATAELVLATERRLARKLRKKPVRRRDTTRTRGPRQVTVRPRRRKAAGHRAASVPATRSPLTAAGEPGGPGIVTGRSGRGRRDRPERDRLR
jgi:hypothetical protein